MNADFLHSHSGLERDLKFPKHTVLVDVWFADMFGMDESDAIKINEHKYLKVNTLAFVNAGGRFKNFSV